MHPIRDRDGSNVPSLSSQVYDCPMPFPLLEVAKGQRSDFVATKSAGQQQGKQRPITFAFELFAVWRLPERYRLFGRQPVAQPNAQFLYALDAPDSGRQIGAEESAIRRLVRQPANRSQSEIDGAWGQMSRLQIHPITDDNGLAEGQPWL